MLKNIVADLFDLAKSTSVSGGNFDIEVDGDQFKVSLTFRIEE